MPSPDDIRAYLRAAASRRRKAEEERHAATVELVSLLKQVGNTDGLSMTEAAGIVGLSRERCYRLMKGER